ncbi:hypothetical protein LCGC14_0686520 [marine sediment metagenome]|uniref:Uncharacterized protein n=1 Tax=marine sediment metagenome TaxID=412755 RepID=A0A0F9QLK9_9ZZZZ
MSIKRRIARIKVSLRRRSTAATEGDIKRLAKKRDRDLADADLLIKKAGVAEEARVAEVKKKEAGRRKRSKAASGILDKVGKGISSISSSLLDSSKPKRKSKPRKRVIKKPPKKKRPTAPSKPRVTKTRKPPRPKKSNRSKR